MHVGFAAKPSELALCIVAMALLSLRDSFVTRKLTAQNRNCFCISKRRECATALVVAADKPFGFLDQPTVEHRSSSLVDAFIQARSRRIHAKTQDAIASKCIAPLLPLLGERL